MARPYWQGQVQISLVSFQIKLFTATEAKGEVRFHQLSRDTGERVKHQKVSGADQGPVENHDIVKGFEVRKGQYIAIEPEEIAGLRIESRQTLQLQQFVNVSEIPMEYFEKPYFCAPEDQSQAEAFAVVRKALQTTQRAGLGKIAFGGREHLVALAAPPCNSEGDSLPGMMVYILRYREELRSGAPYFADIKPVKVEADQLALATELIERKTAPWNPSQYKDEYEAALRELVQAKLDNVKLPTAAPAKQSAQAVSLMDALLRSVKDDAPVGKGKRKPVARAAAETKPAQSSGLQLVKGKKDAKAKSLTRTKSGRKTA